MAKQIKAKSAGMRKQEAPKDMSARDVYDRIYVAILEHRLRPGAKLVEERLADIFGVSRPRIREVLAKLAHEQIVEVFPQRGAYVAKPSTERAAEVIEARRIVEPALVQRLMRNLSPEKVARLRAHLAQEAQALARDDTHSIIRLTSEFHVLLSDLAGNSVLGRAMRELANLSCLITFLYNVPTQVSCRNDDHEKLVDAIEQGSTERAIELMHHHLDHIEQALRLEDDEPEMDLEEIFKT